MFRNLVLVCLACTLSGCFNGEQRVASVSGVITQYGDPLEGATVMFVPVPAKDSAGRKLVIAHGVTDSDGRYQLSMPGGVTGAAIGKHSVMISKIVPLFDSSVEKKIESEEPEETEESKGVESPMDESPFRDSDMRRSLLKASLIANPFRTDQPRDETVFDSFNRDTVLEFEVTASGTTEADFEVGRDPLLEE